MTKDDIQQQIIVITSEATLFDWIGFVLIPLLIGAGGLYLQWRKHHHKGENDG